MKINLKLMDCL